MRRVVAALALLACACEVETTTRFEAEAAARAWLSAMGLRADGVACAGAAGVQDGGWRSCSVRFGNSAQEIWCLKSGCKAGASFIVPPAAVPTKITEVPR